MQLWTPYLNRVLDILPVLLHQFFGRRCVAFFPSCLYSFAHCVESSLSPLHICVWVLHTPLLTVLKVINTFVELLNRPDFWLSYPPLCLKSQELCKCIVADKTLQLLRVFSCWGSVSPKNIFFIHSWLSKGYFLKQPVAKEWNCPE